jgi:hypothetical protein
MAQLSLTPNTNLIANGLSVINDVKQVIDVSGGYQKPIAGIAAAFMKAYGQDFTKTKISSIDQRRTIAVLGDTTVSPQIASSQLVGANLVINFSDPTFQLFSPSELLMDTFTQAQGRVLSVAPGTVTIAPHGGSPFNVATEFLAGGYVTTLGSRSTTRNSTSISVPFADPNTDFNYTSLIRVKTELARRDMMSGNVLHYKGGMWYLSAEAEMLKKLNFYVDRSMLVDKRSFDAPSNTYSNGGLEWLIANRGGLNVSLTSNYTVANYQDAIYQIQTTNQGGTPDIWCLCGTQFLFDMQDNVRNINNVRLIAEYKPGKNPYKVNGVSINVNVMEYSFLGATVKFVVGPALDHQEFWKGATSQITGKLKKSSTAYWLNLAPLEAVGGGSVSPLEIIWAQGPNGNTPFGYGYINGTIKDFNGTLTGQLQQNSISMNTPLFSSSDIDGMTAYAFADIGLDCQDAKGFVMTELAF